MAPATTEAGFLDHLEALRRSLLVAAGFFAAAAILSFLLSEPIVGFLRRPADEIGVPLYVLRPQEKFLTYLKISFSTALLATLPALLLLALRFVMPALTRSEKALLLPAAGIVLLLYLGGVAFAFCVVVPIALGFFASFRGADGIRQLWSFGEYVRILFSLVYAFCLVFQSPVLLLLLIRAGLLRIETLRRYRRHAILLILLLAAVVTPPDVLSQILVAVPLYLLYEGTILVARVWLRALSRKEISPWTEGSF